MPGVLVDGGTLRQSSPFLPPNYRTEADQPEKKPEQPAPPKADRFILRGIAQLGTTYSFSVYDASTQNAKWLEGGASINGFAVEDYDPVTRSITYSLQGHTGKIALSKADDNRLPLSFTQAPAPSAASAPNTPTGSRIRERPESIEPGRENSVVQKNPTAKRATARSSSTIRFRADRREAAHTNSRETAETGDRETVGRDRRETVRNRAADQLLTAGYIGNFSAPTNDAPEEPVPADSGVENETAAPTRPKPVDPPQLEEPYYVSEHLFAATEAKIERIARERTSRVFRNGSADAPVLASAGNPLSIFPRTAVSNPNGKVPDHLR